MDFYRFNRLLIPTNRRFKPMIKGLPMFFNKITRLSKRVSALGAVSILLLVAACEGGPVPDLETYDGETVDVSKRETILGSSGGLTFGGPDKPNRGAGAGTGIGVNAFLWRATLDTMSAWPITSADPFGGVVITDWYAPPSTPSERFKMNIYILDRALRADGIRVSVFRQIKNSAGNWLDATVQASTATKLENAILMRARQFRNRQSQ